MFAESGFDGVSVRDIARAADVTLALVNYHGGGKERLLEQLVERRADKLINARLQALSGVSKASSSEQQVYAILRAYLAPMYDMIHEDPEAWVAYFRMAAWISIDERRKNLIQRFQVEPIIKPFILALQQALGTTSTREATLGIMYLSAGFFNSTVVTYWQDKVDNTVMLDVSDHERHLAMMVGFCQAGIFRAMALNNTQPVDTCLS